MSKIGIYFFNQLLTSEWTAKCLGFGYCFELVTEY